MHGLYDISKKDILEYYFTANQNLTARNIILILIFSLAMAAVIFVTYRLSHTGTAFSVKLAATNVAVILITTVIMMMISSNIVISLGMVGALSIIRFRTAIKDPWDTVYIFWSVVAGLSVGAQHFKLALISTLFIAAVLLLLSLRTGGFRKYLLVIRGDSSADPAELTRQIAACHKRSKLRASNHIGDSRELIYEIAGTGGVDQALLAELKKQPGVTAVSFLEQTGETVG